ncbi:hypothetical protein [Comamonas squillarum]|uniref:Ig-like domain-containing protein n=1 Tax=Comamonas squillarum TaxID=2977320 RepID=A0ABY5ZVY7_9BURK|nr:hypothetical protein [Comamonas sp. PR12]UXC17646.1 hypothetical protein N4T19_18380 [Comamonas sp. PR12]
MYQQQPSSALQAAAWARKAWQGLQMLGLWLMLLCAAPSALAQTPVTGVITSNTTLRAAQSPYLFQGDVIVDNNATLSIEPGVTIQMAAAASFTLKRGALQAVGTPSLPIKITSASATPAAGDWRQWRFTAGTNQALTQLGHVVIEYGSGVAIESASPVINNTAINHHSGPAISMDLASSPVGTGNTANGNSLNAINVPAGTIRTQVVWGIVGIPYLVQQGLVHIGQAPLALEPAKLKLSPGVVAMLRVSLNAPAPAGGTLIDVSSSVPSVASAVTRVTVPEGQTSADLEVQASSLGSTKITASHATLGMAETVIEVVSLPSLGLAPASPTVGVNRNYPMTLSLPAPAASNVAVRLDNADTAVLSAPSSLVVPAGQQSVNFEVTGLVDGTSRLTAQADGYASALATVAVRGKALVLPSSVVVAPTGSTTVTLEATEPAPAGGLTVNLAVAQSSLAQAPATVLIPAGQSRVSFSINGKALGATTLTATAAGYQSGQTSVNVDAISLNTDPAADLVMNEELSRTVRVQLSKAAPLGGITVSVVSQNPAIAAVSPAEVFVPTGQIYATVPVTVKALTEGKTSIGITSLGLIGKTLNVDVRQKFSLRLTKYSGSKLIVGKGLYNYYREFYVERLINGVVSNGAEAVTVNLRCIASEVCITPATVTIPAGQSRAYISVTGVDIGSTQVEATAEGATSAAPMSVDVILPVVRFNSLDKNRTTSSIRDDFSITLTVPGADWTTDQYAANSLQINVSLKDQSPAGVVNGIYNSSNSLITQLTVARGSSSTGTAYIAQPAAAGTYRVEAEVVGVTAEKSEVQTVTAAAQGLRLTKYSGSKLIVGKGLYNYYREFYVERLINGVVSNGAEAVTVNLRCIASEVCITPATVTIPAGQSRAYISVTGVDIGSTQVEATAEGATSAAPMSVDVILPVVRFNSLDKNRTTSSIRDDFSITLTVPGADWTTDQYAANSLQINVSLKDQSPAGVVNGIYNSSNSLITQLTVARGSSSTGTAYIAQPAAAGTYRVEAEVVGVTAEKSEVQTVTAAAQGLRLTKYSGSKLIVGKGLYNYYREFYVERLINGVVSNGAEAVTVNLRCIASEVCITPATVTIPAGQSRAYISVTGVDIGSTQVEATAEGATSAAPMSVDVILPVVRFNSLDKNRTTSSIRDDFSITLTVPGADWTTDQYAANSLQINVSLKDQSPAGVVNGIYNSSNSLITQLTVARGSSSTGTAYIAQPAAAGTYRVEAEVVGVTAEKSEVQTVTAAAQGLRLTKYSGSKLIVGKGLYNYYREFYVERLINGVVSNGAEAVTVNLRCIASEVCITPATVTIPAGQSRAYISVTGVDIGSTQVEATAAGFESGVIDFETINPVLVLSSAPSSLSVGQKSTSIYVRAQVSGAYWSNDQYPAANLTITFSSSVPSVGTVTTTVNWPAGSSSSARAIFTAISPGTTQITASSPGFVPATSGVITVNP